MERTYFGETTLKIIIDFMLIFK